MINKLIIDSSDSFTDLCKLGADYRTDKSPYLSPLSPYFSEPGEHGHAYSAVYDFLFSSIRFKKIKLAEIGIQFCKSIEVFREYFPNSEIYGFESHLPYLEDAPKKNIPGTSYFHIDVANPSSIIQAMNNCNQKFDIIIDDSSHVFEHQILLISLIHEYMNPGGIFIIEDLWLNTPDSQWETSIEPYKHYYSNITFVEPKHKYQFSGDWKNDKLIVLYK